MATTTLSYIDETTEAAIVSMRDDRTVLPEQKEAARKAAQKVVSGFRVFDEDAEKAHLDSIINANKRKAILFFEDKANQKQRLSEIGITPLAIVPRTMWSDICKRAKLFTLAPVAGRVWLDRAFLHGLSEAAATQMFNSDRYAFLAGCLPRYEEPDPRQTHCVAATVVLPDPPADVANILLKMIGFEIGLDKAHLKVAAVAEAISFAESISELVRHSRFSQKDLWARQQGYEDYADWVKRDPIVFYETAFSACIVAQFGDFPVEKDVVDTVVGKSAFLDTAAGKVEMETRTPYELAEVGRQYYSHSELAGVGLGLGYDALSNTVSNVNVAPAGVFSRIFGRS